MAKLTPEEIENRIAKYKGWSYKGNFLVKNFKFKKFMQGIEFVNLIAKLAEKVGHHPDIHIRWTNVGLEVQSHDEGGVTERDINLVKEIEKLLKLKQGRNGRKRREGGVERERENGLGKII